MSVLQRLTEGVQHRDMQAEGAALLNKWEATGLLEGLNEGNQKQGMAVLLENQAKELLREASSMAAGDVEGFAAVAFPIVRRVFGGLIANDLISVQPMSLPSGLIFFMDFTHSDARGGFGEDSSLYGGGVVGREIIDGVQDITETGFYGLRSGYSAAAVPVTLAAGIAAAAEVANPEKQSSLDYDVDLAGKVIVSAVPDKSEVTEDAAALALLDPGQARALAVKDSSNTTAIQANSAGTRILAGDGGDIIFVVAGRAKDAGATTTAHNMGTTNAEKASVFVLRPVRRLTKFVTATNNEGLLAVQEAPLSRLVFEVRGSAQNILDVKGADAAAVKVSLDALSSADIRAAVKSATLSARTAADASGLLKVASLPLILEFPGRDDINASQNALGALQAGAMPLEEATNVRQAAGSVASGAADAKNAIPEIDIKVDSVAVTAQTKKLKAKWTPELGQDLNAYHNLDAEVELTGILSEQIALEIDRELLSELVDGAKAGTRYWSRAPGLFVDSSGGEIGASSAAPDFTGTVSEWYETLIETINDVSAQIHRKTLRGGANFVVCSPEVANILEFTSGFRASVTADQDRGTIGAVKAGSLSKKFDVYVDPYFLRNVLLVGRKGSSFLESGYVYAPYVPLQVTPTIFGTEDFVPRKGVMTRYAKKMVRPDMYGLVIVRGLLGEEGAKV